ncbi:type IX secretion system membrane protein PorP/SprF [Maribacter sp. BPC-D8]|uniref:PorP/SprF family type IX secretion system membrane protein n=1 Tax=Maribacter sp. BPC-D8 TaxID=3053613 RepID=UPI002B489DCB|nr:type IX secretion system membrane protein PorP/SprF [Maribacter sp. BPC-D8]WRI28307.1 type IX secretion system membrane protein PorP/SprF [Maribacter sp. BPC-D8]
MKLSLYITIIIVVLIGTAEGFAQQDPQYTHYNYNTMTVNSAYTGSRGNLAIISLYRNQWVGVEGAPKTLTFGIDSPIGKYDGVGLSIVQDEIGPSSETYIDGNYAHQLVVNRKGDKLAFGLKAGVRFLSIDWSKGLYRDEGDVFLNENVNGKLLPSIGAGAFYYTRNAYIGLSTPNILTNTHYDEIQEAESVERIHIFLIGGYVFDLNPFLKFKPSFFVKHVVGAPLSADVSANFLMNEKLTLGVNYRWDDSVSALFGLQITPQLNMGYAYDFSTTQLTAYNSGTHEIFLRFMLKSSNRIIKSPRFF